MLVKTMQLEKAELLIVIIEFGILILVNPIQPLKPLLPIEVTLFGMDTMFMLMQPSKEKMG